ALVRLDHDDAERQSRDDTVSPREMTCLGRRAHRKFRYQSAAVGDFAGKLAMAGRVDPVDARTEDGDRPAAAGQRPPMAGAAAARSSSPSTSGQREKPTICRMRAALAPAAASASRSARKTASAPPNASASLRQVTSPTPSIDRSASQ